MYKPIYNLTYRCADSGHIMSPWSPQSKSQKHRVCVIPGCKFTEVKDATA